MCGHDAEGCAALICRSGSAAVYTGRCSERSGQMASVRASVTGQQYSNKRSSFDASKKLTARKSW